MLFICGQHRLAVTYSKEFADPEFTALYQDYYEQHMCLGLPKDKILSHYNKNFSQSRTNDAYKALLVHLMIGSAGNEDKNYLKCMLL